MNFDYDYFNQLIDSRGIKNSWIAKQVGVSDSYISQIRSKKRNPSQLLVKALSNVFGVQKEDLLLLDAA